MLESIFCYCVENCLADDSSVLIRNFDYSTANLFSVEEDSEYVQFERYQDDRY